ncbi:hypothetical protein BGZ61DRAFT_27796 [Ilyonectria robusta]|uniref:uncharacterized protein n=1 Tax=Ilyonectria robusta TaxID=1079257 RepID=UPI001E8E4700|nr:uncharacterized protein BGZ61DRAFT_27796 [Ilyonectria robusta]KAH8738090.1 hypothetical protein BGZ61DRAFT_27796 [Ilyonectria robusta]
MHLTGDRGSRTRRRTTCCGTWGTSVLRACPITEGGWVAAWLNETSMVFWCRFTPTPISAGTYMSVSLSPPVTRSPFHALQNIGHFPLSISQHSVSPQMTRRHCLLCCPSEQQKQTRVSPSSGPKTGPRDRDWPGKCLAPLALSERFKANPILLGDGRVKTRRPMLIMFSMPRRRRTVKMRMASAYPCWPLSGLDFLRAPIETSRCLWCYSCS